jgi:hypothetical protein
LRRSEFKALLTIGIIGAVVAASVYGGYIDFTPSVVSTDVDDDQSTTLVQDIDYINTTTVLSATVMGTADYIISRNGTDYEAVNGTTGSMAYSSSNASRTFQYCADELSTGGYIVVRPATYVLTYTITLASGTLVNAQTATFDITGLNDCAFDFGVNTQAGWQWSLSVTDGEKFTGLINAELYGKVDNTNTNTLAVRISQVNAGAIVRDVTTKHVNNVVVIQGACYGALIQNVKGHYGIGTFIKLVGEDFDGVTYAANDAFIDHCEMTAYNANAVGVNNTDDGVGDAASAITISNCWLEGMHYCIRTEGVSTKVSDCNLQAYTTGTANRCILQTSDGEGLMVTSCGMSTANENAVIIEANADYSVIGCDFESITCPAIVQADASGLYSRVIGNHISVSSTATALTAITGRFQYSEISNNIFMTGADRHSGIVALSGSAVNVVSGNTFSNWLVGIAGYMTLSSMTGNAFSSCIVGINGTDMGTACSITGNEFYSCTSAVTGHTPNANDVGNAGWVIKKSGSATINSGQWSVTVTHGMYAAPTKVVVTGSSNETKDLFVTNIGATTFVINSASATSGNTVVYWYAEA